MVRRNHDAWEKCIALLRVLQQQLRSFTRIGVPADGGARAHRAAATAWERARLGFARLVAHRAGARSRVDCAVEVEGDLFHADRAAWGRRLGFGVEAVQSWTADDEPSSLGNFVSEPLLDQLQLRLVMPAGEQLEAAKSWIADAQRARGAALRLGGRSHLASRASALRAGDLKVWSRLFKGPRTSAPGFASLWLQAASGVRVRPSTAAQARLAVAQEWSLLFHHPPIPWRHPFIRQWSDAAGRPRGSLDLAVAAAAPCGSIGRRLGEALLWPCSGLWHLIRWTATELVVMDERTVSVPGAILRRNGPPTSWTAERPGPCAGRIGLVVCIQGEPAEVWCADRWWHARSSGEAGFLLCQKRDPVEFWGDLVAPTRPSERRSLVDGRLNSRPGPSGWKLFFLRLFPEWAQGAYWQLVDTQRSCALVAHQAKLADQVHIPKTSGGIRPLSMLEESLKAIEGVSSRRRVLARKDLRVGQIYASSNLAGEPGFQAAAEAMYVDCFVCEDSLRHFMPLSRVGADYENFFSTIVRSACDALEECRGVPDDARRLMQECFEDFHVSVETRWGPTEPIHAERSMPQGSVSGPEMGKPAQEVVLRLRQSSDACYMTSHGRSVACVGFVDDSLHFGAGASHIPTIL